MQANDKEMSIFFQEKIGESHAGIGNEKMKK